MVSLLGLIGQSWNVDGTAVDGRADDYKFSKEHPVVRTESMAEGAIEGSADLYELSEPFATDFTGLGISVPEKGMA